MSSGLRAQLRQFLVENLPEDWRDASSGSLDDESIVEIRREWGRILYRGGWSAPTLTASAGGLGLTGADLVAYFEEIVASGAPEALNANAIGILAPVLAAYGTAEQCSRTIDPMLAHDLLWCQGFSEPEAGSDLVRIRTRAVPDGDGWALTGQKVWTSNAKCADRCYVLVRPKPGQRPTED